MAEHMETQVKVQRRGARSNVISPWGLSWDDENYYLVGYDSDADMIKHYRVDKMLRIKVENTATYDNPAMEKG